MAIKSAVSQPPPQQQQQPRSQPAPPQPLPIPFSDPSTTNTYNLQPPTSVHSLDAVASVALDPLLNVTCLNLKRGNEVQLQPDGSAFVTQPGTNGQTPVPYAQIIPPHAPTVVRRRQQQITEELHAAHQDPEVALKAINFILAYDKLPSVVVADLILTKSSGLSILVEHISFPKQSSHVQASLYHQTTYRQATT